MKIDLIKDYETVYKHIVERVNDYPKYVNQGPGEDEDPVSMIELGFYYEQVDGWIALVFDTRPGARPDGEWNSYIEENMLKFPHWLEYLDRMVEEEVPVTLILHDGTERTIDPDCDMEEIAGFFGEMLRAALIAARDNGVLAKLPLADPCIMGIEEMEGYYGWPAYNDLLKKGRVN